MVQAGCWRKEVGDRARLACIMSSPDPYFPGGFWRPLVVSDLGCKEDLARTFNEELSHNSEEGKTFSLGSSAGISPGVLNNDRKLASPSPAVFPSLRLVDTSHQNFRGTGLKSCNGAHHCAPHTFPPVKAGGPVSFSFISKGNL